ncbi:MAG: glycosyltransferase family 9 protein [Nitrospirota bacterium]
MWEKRYLHLGEGLKIGISWRGGSNRKRSVEIGHWRNLFSVPRIKFINLQYGDCTDEIFMIHDQFDRTIYDWEDSDPLKDLDNFAAQIAALDLVISIDNATVHMAGALGTPVWTLLSYSSDWRWMLDREDSPWYPSMRLFRQPAPGDWESAMTNIKFELLNLSTKFDN